MDSNITKKMNEELAKLNQLVVQEKQNRQESEQAVFDMLKDVVNRIKSEIDQERKNRFVSLYNNFQERLQRTHCCNYQRTHATKLALLNLLESNNSERNIKKINKKIYQMTCCFCIKLHQGFFKIIYIDIARIIYGLTMTALVFTSDMSTSLDYVSTILLLISIFVQTVLALLAYFKGIPYNKYSYYRLYHLSKWVYIASNITYQILVPIIDCSTLY